MSRRAASLVFLAVVLGAGSGVFAWYWFAPRPNTGLPPEQLDEVGKMNYRWITASPWERWKWAHAMISAHGIVVDELGAPIPGARVSYAIQIDGDWNPPPTVDMKSDENGRFTVPEGRGYGAPRPCRPR